MSRGQCSAKKFKLAIVDLVTGHYVCLAILFLPGVFFTGGCTISRDTLSPSNPLVSVNTKASEPVANDLLAPSFASAQRIFKAEQPGHLCLLRFEADTVPFVDGACRFDEAFGNTMYAALKPMPKHDGTDAGKCWMQVAERAASLPDKISEAQILIYTDGGNDAANSEPQIAAAAQSLVRNQRVQSVFVIGIRSKTRLAVEQSLRPLAQAGKLHLYSESELLQNGDTIVEAVSAPFLPPADPNVSGEPADPKPQPKRAVLAAFDVSGSFYPEHLPGKATESSSSIGK